MYDQYQGLIFDMDGSLLDTGTDAPQRLALYGMQFDEAAVVSLNGSSTYWLTKTAALHNILFDDVTALHLIDVVKRYHGKHLMALGIGSEHAMAEALLRHFELLYYFDAIFGADDVKSHKSNSQTFLRCVELIGVLLEACVVFEDANFGIIAARAAKMAFVDVRALSA